jgi:general nucleoside transport system permease protein
MWWIAMNIWDATLLLTVLAGTLRAATPLIFAGLGELINERGGVLNLGLEGLMLVGASLGIAAQILWGQWWLSLLFAGLGGSLVGCLHSYFCVYLRSHQIVTGLAFVFLCQGLTSVLAVDLVGNPIFFNPPKPFWFLKDVPVIGRLLSDQDIMVFVAFALIAVVGFVLWRTRWGILLRACGENPASARSSGVPVRLYRMSAGTICGFLCGIGGAHFSLFHAQQWQENMISGRGWIALVLVIFSGWKPGSLLLGAWFFGGLTTLQLNLQSRGLNVSQYLLAMIPFVATIFFYCLATMRIGKGKGSIPSSLGKTFDGQAEP